LPEDSFYSTSENFHYFDNNDNPCDGVFNMRRCTNGSVFLSQPHFLNANKKFLNNIEGLKPNKSSHDLIFQLEPVI
jgi:hypothetical protein